MLPTQQKLFIIYYSYLTMEAADLDDVTEFR